jgi:hypothetical protein
METSQTETSAMPVTPVPQTPGILATKIPATTSFVIAIAVFLMPFLDIRCNEMSLKKINGVELATGYQIDSPGKSNSLFGGLENKETGSFSKKEKKESNMYALAALLIGAAGLGLSLLNAKTAMAAAAATGALAAVALIGLMVDINRQVSSQQAEQSKDVVISVNFTVWFYLSVLAFLAAAFFSYQRMKQSK